MKSLSRLAKLILAAPISHHWLDSTYISYGVLTAGVAQKTWQLEGSWFNGREPDEDRWDIEHPHLDSYSGRITWNPTPAWSAQISHGYLKSPEELHPLTQVYHQRSAGNRRLRAVADAKKAPGLEWSSIQDTPNRQQRPQFLRPAQAAGRLSFTFIRESRSSKRR